MKKNISIKNIVSLFLAIWVIYSVVYIAKDQWMEFQNTKIKAAYQQGVADSVLSLMKESEKCEPITVFAQDEQIQLIPVECLESAE